MSIPHFKSMIKKIKENFRTYMIRPIIYYTVTRAVVVFTLCLLWDRFINDIGPQALYNNAFFFAGVVFVAFTWIYYLALDGMHFHYLFEDRHQKRPRKKFWHADMADFADEKIIPMDELEDVEKLICRFIGNLICAVFYFAMVGIGSAFL